MEVEVEDKNKITIDIVDSLSDCLESIKKLKKSLRVDEVLCFRGSSNIANGPLPGIFWENDVDESSFYHDLILEYPEEFDCKKDHLGTLAKMQHYGLPTRMLDVSGNAFVSLYFATSSNVGKDGYVDVFKVKKSEILKHNSDKALMLSCLPCLDKKSQESIRLFCENNKGKINESMIKNDDAMVRFLHEIRGEYPAFECAIIGEDLLNSYFVRANKNNQRMKIQDGYFIIHGLDNDKFNEFVDSHLVGKMIIKSGKKSEFLSDLNSMGIRDDVIFPDLERTALFLRSKKLGWRSLDE